MTIAQIVYDNEIHFGYTDQEVHDKVGLRRCPYQWAADHPNRQKFVSCHSSCESGA